MKRARLLIWAAGLALCVASPACSDDETTRGSQDAREDPGAGGFTFSTSDPSTYARVDRAGMPAVNTAIITSKDAYNAADPADDANGDFVSEITTNIEGLHDALDDDLAGLGLATCSSGTSPDLDVTTCVSQGAPLIVPDTLTHNTANAAGFPNGRALEDPVIDVTLAVILLDLTSPGDCGGAECTVTTLASVPVNPGANDQAFGTSFPYLAGPN